MIHNWITDVNRELHQWHTQPTNFINPIAHVLSPPGSCDETSVTDFITPPSTPCRREDYPTPPPSRSDVFYSNHQDSSPCYQETENTASSEREVPEFLDFLLDHPSVGPKFQNVDEAKAFILGSLDEFYSRTESGRSGSAFSNGEVTLLHASENGRKTPPLDVVYDGPIFQSVDEAKEYILNAVHEFYSTTRHTGFQNLGTSSMMQRGCQWQNQHFEKSVNFRQESVELGFWR